MHSERPPDRDTTLLPNADVQRDEMVSTGSNRDDVDLDGMRSYLDGTDVVFALLFGSHARGTADETSDVDIAVQFPATFDAHDRFRARNRIDADLQQFATNFVDVSDIEQLPTEVAYKAVRHSITLVGDEDVVDSYRNRIREEYDSTAAEREREKQAFIDRLARGDG